MPAHRKEHSIGFPAMVSDIESLQTDIQNALQRTWLMLGSLVASCSGLGVYLLIRAG